MIFDRVLRFILASFLSTLGLAVLSQPAMAAGPRHTMSPFLRLASQEILANVPAGVVAPQYGLFGCQVGLSVGQCYDPFQMRHAYGVDSLIAAGYDGSGHTIVIVDAFQNPNLVSQVAHFDAFYGLPAINLTQYAPDGLTPFVPGDANMTGWAEEISLDVEWAHAIAPGANIVLVLAKSNNDPDILSAVKYAVDNNLGDVISMSFGENESCVDPVILSGYHDVFAAATQKNITLFASSADQGAALQTCDGNSWVKAVSSPASDPLVAAVGGTELRAADFCLTALGCNPATHPAPGTYQSEIAWNEGLPFGDFGNIFGVGTLGTGGGFSVLFDEPPYQQGTIHGGKQRAVPDVAYNAAVLHGVLTYLNIPGVAPGFYRFGGTSAGSPQWAAITAIANQKAGGRLGFLNSALYQIGKVNKADSASFHDITQGTNSSAEFDSSNKLVTVIGFDAGIGWDATTGSGSPISSSLVDNLIKYVSPGDGTAAVATTKPKPHPKPIIPGSMDPH
ncbi:MAG TPA: S53 family peptidase [Casimicrobiaceae bacterium]|nr:S53 family peptidase [Casimicrobiaceae bacterium]